MRSLVLALFIVSSAFAQTVPSPDAAQVRALVRQATDLTGRDRAAEAITLLRKAIALAPDSVAAHRQYVRTRAYFLGELDAVKAEYESLAAKNPTNPVYPLTLLLGLETLVDNQKALWKTVAALAPDWSWGHCAKGWVIFGRTYFLMNEKADAKGEQAIAEFLRAAELDPSVPDFYEDAIFFQEAFGRLAEALAIAQRMAARPETRAAALPIVWRLRLAQAKGSAEAQAALRAELAKLSAGATDLELIAAIHRGYRDVLKDQAAAEALERQIAKLDPSWYPERGCAEFFAFHNKSGILVPVWAVNRQCAVLHTIQRIALRHDPDWRAEAADYRKLLDQNPNPALQTLLHSLLFRLALDNGDIGAMQRHADRLLALDPTNLAPQAFIARALADQGGDLSHALALASRVEAALAEFHPLPRPANVPSGSVPSVAEQQENYRRQRALALDAMGWVLWKSGKGEEAAAKLRQSVELDRTPETLSHLAAVLDGLGKQDEAGALRSELDQAAAAAIERNLLREPAPDFEFDGLDGKRHKLSEYRGKVVLVTFWATYCGPCVGEMPLFARAYAKYKDQGFEVLAISCDNPEDRDKARRFVEQHGLPFAAGYDVGAARLYKANGYPLNLVIDREGALRYRQEGAFDSSGRELDLVLKKLLFE
jgi:peroxiredoxin